jgi:protein-S-isoprenylcysteine O-methyltransferase Ste14
MSETYEQQVDASCRNGTLHIHPPLLAAILLIAGLLLHLAIGHHHRAVHFSQLLALLLVAAGTGLGCYAAALFAARDTTKNPYGQPTAFVNTPPYTFTRNPMYVGFATALLGFAVFFESPAMLLAPVVFVLVIDRMVIPQEEETLQRLFGEQYYDYTSRVSRWLPLPFSSSP